jgi:Flp pilus assembly protein TadG
MKRSSIVRQTRDRKPQKGAAYLEFAFVVPFFLVFVMGIVEFGRGFNIYHNLTNACREGARLAAMRDNKQITLTSSNVVRDRVVNYMNSLGLQTSPYAVTGVPDTSTPPTQSSTDYIYGSRTAAYLVIDQGATIQQKDANGNLTGGGSSYVGSKVELCYPYTVPMFSTVVRLLIPSANYSGTFYIKNSATIEN